MITSLISSIVDLFSPSPRGEENKNLPTPEEKEERKVEGKREPATGDRVVVHPSGIPGTIVRIEAPFVLLELSTGERTLCNLRDLRPAGDG